MLGRDELGAGDDLVDNSFQITKEQDFLADLTHVDDSPAMTVTDEVAKEITCGVVALMHAFPSIKAARAVALTVHERGSINQSLWAPLLPVPGSPADVAIEAAAKHEAALNAALAA